MSRVRSIADDDGFPMSTLELESLNRIENSTQNVAGGEERETHHHHHHQVHELPSVLSFSNLTYSVKTCQKTSIPTCFHRNNRPAEVTKVLLNDISGEAGEGEILAVLGASGSGKTTLIDALANRISEGSLKGSVTLNGGVLESRLLKSISAYVMQDDLLFPMLTVEETLMFSAEFRLPRSLSKSKKKARVEALIDQLGLRNAAKTVIGDEGHRGVSGGERHRVSIGVEIVHDPMILFLDEPTTGLDSTHAFMVIEVLQRIARSGSIVIMSIHQPSYRILGLLDHLMFLSQGETVYSGPPSDLPLFFSAFNHPIPVDENWSEFALDLIHDLEAESPEGTKNLIKFNKSWQESRSGSCGKGAIINANIYHQAGVAQAVKAAVNKSVYGLEFANPFWIEMMLLVKRSIRNERRMPAVHGIRLLAVIFTAFILATLFLNLDDSPRGVQERLGFFNFAISTAFYTCIDVIPFYLQERNIFIREIAHNAYRRSSYVIAHSIIAIPMILIYSISFSVITFWAVGLSGGFFFYFLMILVSFWAGSSFVAFVSGVLTQQIVVAYVVGAAILSYFIIFCGFYITRDRIPSYWIWLYYISLAKYPYQGGLLNEFDDPSKCYVSGVQMFDNTPLKTISTEAKIDFLKTLSSGYYGMNITPTTCVTNGVGILKEQAVTDLSKWDCFWIMIAWGVLFRILFYVCLMVGSKNKRK